MTAQVENDIVTKGRFAEICNVSPGRVSQWIAEGKISAGLKEDHQSGVLYSFRAT